MPGRYEPKFVQDLMKSFGARMRRGIHAIMQSQRICKAAAGQGHNKPRCKGPRETAAIQDLKLGSMTQEGVKPMRHSQHTDSEILHLLYEADAGISIAEICRTAHISLRTFYRWRRRYGSLTPPALLLMKELQAENRRLRALVDKLSERPHEALGNTSPPAPRVAPRPDYGFGPQVSPEQMRGASLGRFASVRGTR
jgi:putative transposase